ncbi:MAG: AraC family transcriptional regulator, partial [Gaiellales bacterium]
PRPARLPLHTHAAPYFCLVLKGAFDERVGGTVYEARSGTLLFHPPGETHSDEIRSEETVLLNIALGGCWRGRLEQLEKRQRPSPGRQSAAAAHLARRIADELPARDLVSSLAIEGLVLTLIAETARSPASLRGGSPSWMPVVLDFIGAHFRVGLDYGALARVAGVHPAHLSRAFRSHMRCTVSGYVRRLRIDWARECLARGDTALVDVALEAGFSDHAHFTRVFRRETGMTPSGYRRLRRSRA